RAFHVTGVQTCALPILVDIPRDVLQSIVPAEAWQRRPRVEVKLQEPDLDLIAEAARQIAQAARPVLYAGGGVITANAHEALVAQIGRASCRESAQMT